MIYINDNQEIIVENVQPVYRGSRIIKFITTISIAEINRVYDRLLYDEETQRGFREKRDRNKIKIQRIENRKNIKEMELKIRNDFFDGGILTWNARLENKEDTLFNEYEYILEKQKLIIKKDKVTLPDSAQRHEAIHNLLGYTVSLDQDTYYFPLQICLYDLVEEKSLFSEINGCGQRAYKNRSLYLSNTYKSMVLKNIISESNLKDNIETKSNTTNGTDKLVTFGTLYDSLFDSTRGAFKYTTDDDVKDIQEWLVRFFNYLIEIRPELGKLTKEERRSVMDTSVISNAITITAFAFVAKSLKGNNNWKRNLDKLNKPYKAGLWNGDIFSLENPLWHGTICSKTKDGKWKVNNGRRSTEFIIDILTKYLNLVKI